MVEAVGLADNRREMPDLPMHDRRQRHCLPRLAENQTVRKLRFVGERPHFRQVCAVRAGAIPREKIHLLETGAERQHQGSERQRPAEEQVPRIFLRQRQFFGRGLHRLRRRAADRPAGHFMEQRRQPLFLAEGRLKPREAADCPIDEGPGVRPGRALALLPGPLPGVEGAREIAVMKIGKPQIGQQRWRPAGLGIPGQKRCEAAEIVRPGPVFIGRHGLRERAVFGRGCGDGRDERLGKMRRPDGRRDGGSNSRTGGRLCRHCETCRQQRHKGDHADRREEKRRLSPRFHLCLACRHSPVSANVFGHLGRKPQGASMLAPRRWKRPQWSAPRSGDGRRGETGGGYWDVQEKQPHTPEPHVGDSDGPEAVLVCEVRLPFAS